MSKEDEVLGNIVIALHRLRDCPEFTNLIPEVRVNLVYALPDARTPQEVAAVEGRITAVNGLTLPSGLPAFGASDHMARLVIEVRKYDAGINAGINFKCDKEILEVVKEYCAEKRLTMGWIDRTKEPARVAEIDRSSMPWKIEYLARQYGKVPRIFYEGVGWGKEPLFVVLGKDALEVTDIAIDIARRYVQKAK